MKLRLAALVAIVGLTAILLPVVIRAGGAVDSGLGPADTYFVTQTSLGTPFQVDSGARRNKGDHQSHSKLRAADGKFPYRREQRTNGDSEEQGANAATYAFESGLLHDGFHPPA